MKRFERIASVPGQLIPTLTLQARGFELRGDTAATFGYPEGIDLLECLWYSVRNAVLNQSRAKREPAGV